LRECEDGKTSALKLAGNMAADAPWQQASRKSRRLGSIEEGWRDKALPKPRFFAPRLRPMPLW
jgi:hypothetical protein